MAEEEKKKVAKKPAPKKKTHPVDLATLNKLAREGYRKTKEDK